MDIKLTATELTYLIEVSTREQPIQVAFGASGSRLKDLPVNKWAIELVTEARKVANLKKENIEQQP